MISDYLTLSQAVLMHTFNPSDWEAETGGTCKFKASPGTQRKFKDSQGYYTEKAFSPPHPTKKKKDEEGKEEEKKKRKNKTTKGFHSFSTNTFKNVFMPQY